MDEELLGEWHRQDVCNAQEAKKKIMFSSRSMLCPLILSSIAGSSIKHYVFPLLKKASRVLWSFQASPLCTQPVVRRHVHAVLPSPHVEDIDLRLVVKSKIGLKNFYKDSIEQRVGPSINDTEVLAVVAVVSPMHLRVENKVP